MALLKFGAIITDTRGSIGGTTVKLTRAGPVIQNKSNPTRRLSQLTALQKARVALLADAWKNTLTAPQREDWRDFAAANPLPNTWGDLFPITGVAFYLRVNLALASVGAARLDDAPADQSVTAFTSATLTVTAPNTASLAYAPTPIPASHALLVTATPTLSPGLATYESKMTILTTIAAAAASPQSIATPWNLKIGDFIAGKQYAITARLVKTTNGARTPTITSAALAL